MKRSPVRRARSLVAAGLALGLLSACATDSGSCPRFGVETGRSCQRACVVSLSRTATPLDCHCMAECVCWQMSGHVRRPEADAAAAR